MSPPPRKPPPPESDTGKVVLWTLLGIGYYILVTALLAAVGSLLPRSFRGLMAPGFLGLLLAPVLAYWFALSQLGPEKREERRGLGIALALFYGLSCLAPLVICGGLLAAGGLRNMH